MIFARWPLGNSSSWLHAAGESIILPTFERAQTQILTKSVGGNPVQETDLRAERNRNV